MKTIGVIGAGTMGIGVTQCLIEFGYEVLLYDISSTVLENVKKQILRNIRMKQLFQVDKLGINETIFERVHLISNIAEVRSADIIIENIDEDFEAKKKVYLELDNICHSDCIFMINTSCISITKIAACTERSEKVIGTHFMNPVPLVDSVEVVRGFNTSEETIEVTKKFLKTLNKQSIIVNDYPGFVANRISHLMMNEAAFILEEQIADVKSIDEIFKKCYGHKMGPLETADLIGLDTVVKSLDVLYESFQDTKFRCCPLLRKMVDAGLYGRKSGKGFYTYEI